MMEFVGFLGWCAAVVVFASLLNFVLKVLHKRYIMQQKDLQPELVRHYRRFMQIIVKNHRYLGLLALAVFLTHLVFSVLAAVLSITGVLTGIMLVLVVSLGAYGFYINRNLRGNWVNVHRGAAFMLGVVLVSHILLKAYIHL
jgi:hypothetical protein